jgi:hypothetical protein
MTLQQDSMRVVAREAYLLAILPCADLHCKLGKESDKKLGFSPGERQQLREVSGWMKTV